MKIKFCHLMLMACSIYFSNCTNSDGMGYMIAISAIIADVRAVELEEMNNTLPSANNIVNS